MMSIDGFRVPLQEQKNELNTPLPFKVNQKITTPPESISNVKRKHSHISMETPIKNYDNFEGFDQKALNRNLLLSPAFSSPQNQFKYNGSNGVNTYQYLKPTHQPMPQGDATYNSSPPQTSNLSSFDDEFDQERPRKKKTKKDKKAFDILSSDKPPYSYANLIGMSILSHPDRRLTLSSIYQWISDTFRYYKKEDVGWQNSIRHNLSLNKAFIKGEKSKDGKGHFWCIEEGSEDQFLKSRNNKKSSYHEIMEQIQIQHQSQQQQKSDPVQIPTQEDKQEPTSFSSQKKRALYSLPSSPNYYESNNVFTKLNSAADYHRQTAKKQHEDEQQDKETDLDAPFNQNWALSPQQAKVEKPSDILNTPKFVVTESPIKPLVAGKSLTFTSSFSCNSNLELSPIRPNETGPLLEPLTPGKIYKPGAVNHHLNFQYPQTQQLFPSNQSQPNQSSTQGSSHQFTSQNQASQSSEDHQSFGLQPPKPQQVSSSVPSNYLQPNTNTHSRTYSGSFAVKTPKSNTLKTPLRILKTPQTNLKKLWNSPGYLDDFYYSPLITSQSALHSYDDDDMILRAFESPANNYKKVSNGASIDSSRILFNDRKLGSAIEEKVDKINKIDEN